MVSSRRLSGLSTEMELGVKVAFARFCSRVISGMVQQVKKYGFIKETPESKD